MNMIPNKRHISFSPLFWQVYNQELWVNNQGGPSALKKRVKNMKGGIQKYFLTEMDAVFQRFSMKTVMMFTR